MGWIPTTMDLGGNGMFWLGGLLMALGATGLVAVVVSIAYGRRRMEPTVDEPTPERDEEIDTMLAVMRDVAEGWQEERPAAVSAAVPPAVDLTPELDALQASIVQLDQQLQSVRRLRRTRTEDATRPSPAREDSLEERTLRAMVARQN